MEGGRESGGAGVEGRKGKRHRRVEERGERKRIGGRRPREGCGVTKRETMGE